MNAVLKNEMSAVETTIASIMNDATAGANKQANLVVALFDNEVSFPNDILLNVLRKEKKDRTTARENLLRSVSHEYAKACDTITVLKDKGKKDRSEKEAFQQETLNNKIRAANIMFDRAMVTVVGLRESKAKTVKTSAIGAGALEVKAEDADGDLVKHKQSCASALTAATKIVNKLLGKDKKDDDKAPNPAKAGMVATVETVSRYLEISMKADGETAVHGIADFSDDTEKALRRLFDQLFYLTFGSGADVQIKDVKEYAAELAKRPITVANGNGATKPETQEQKKAS